VIPMLAIVAVRPGPRPRRRLWIPLPLFLLWLLLLPVAVVLLPVTFVVCWATDVNPFRALSAVWGILSGLGSTRIEVDHRDASIYVRFY
jgi:hypothetical protein